MLKKEEVDESTDNISRMREQGFSQDEISQNLEKERYNQQNSDEINQRAIKNEIRDPYQESAMSQLEREAPTPQQAPLQQRIPKYQGQIVEERAIFPESPPAEYPRFERTIKDQVEELVESVVSEKWDEMISSLGNISLWKEKVRDEIISIKQEILRLEKRFENLQKSLFGKVSEYSKDIEDVGAEIKALEQVFQKILTPLTTNIKELSKITAKLKSKK